MQKKTAYDVTLHRLSTEEEHTGCNWPTTKKPPAPSPSRKPGISGGRRWQNGNIRNSRWCFVRQARGPRKAAPESVASGG